jgi:hypothetical protein
LPLRWDERAQQRLYRLAIVDPALSAADLSEDKPCCTHLAFYKELRRLGYVEGQNLVVGLYSGAICYVLGFGAMAREPLSYPILIPGRSVAREPNRVLVAGPTPQSRSVHD